MPLGGRKRLRHQAFWKLECVTSCPPGSLPPPGNARARTLVLPAIRPRPTLGGSAGSS
jgi:hypothetical protein